MYDIVLFLHSWLRWIALGAGIMATITAFAIRPATGSEAKASRWGLFFMIALDLQLVIGLLLYVALSPTTAEIFDNFGEAMRDPVARFWAVEHITMMLIAVILAHVGRVLARKARTPSAERARMLIAFGLATLLIIIATPWPGFRAGRELFRGLF
jgi:hypothetical protein